jgi:hypothetical protein
MLKLIVFPAAAFLASVSVGAGIAHAQLAEVVFAAGAHAPTSPKSLVPASSAFPGLSGARFRNFDFPLTRTPTSNDWYSTPSLTLTPALPTWQDQIVLRGNGVSGAIQAQEGVTSFGTSGLFLGLSVGGQAVRGNDSGQWTLASRSNTATAISSAASNEDRVFVFNGTALSSLVKSADLAPIFDPAATWGVTTSGTTPVFTFAAINSVGAVSFLGRNIVDPVANSVAAIAVDNASATALRANVTIPTGQLDPTPVTIRDISQFQQSATGAARIALATLNTTTDRDSVAILGQAVVLQEGAPIPGSGFVSNISSISEVVMESDGTWFARGSNVDNTNWVVRSGVVLAKSGDPVVTGSTEVWESFRDVKGDALGRWVINGNSNAPTLTDDILVAGGLAPARIIARESDPVDLDNDGATETNLHLHLFQNRGTLNNDLNFYFACRLKTNPTDTVGVSNSTDASLIRISICAPDFNRDGRLTVADIFDFLSAWFAATPRADYNRAGGITVQDIFDFLDAWFVGC